MEDAEDLVGVDGAEGEVVVGVAAVVEVESAEQVGVKEPGDDLFDVLREVVMAGVDEDKGLGAGLAAQVGRPCPSRQCRCGRKAGSKGLYSTSKR